MEQHRRRGVLVNGEHAPSIKPYSTTRRTSVSVMDRQFSGAWAQTTHARASTLIQASWALILGQIADSKDVSFSATMVGSAAVAYHGREDNVPTVPVRVRMKLSGAERVSEYLETVQQQVARTGHVPEVEVEGDRDAQQDEMCQLETLVVIEWPQTSDTHEARQNDGRAQQLEPFRLVLRVSRDINTMAVSASAAFDSATVDPWLVRMLLGRLEQVLYQFDRAELDALVSEIDIIGPEEVERIWQWNMTVPKPMHACIHEIIADRAHAQPEASALCAWDGELTYRRLDELSTRLANTLAGDGIDLSAFVALCFEKSMWTMVAILGVLKAGSAFVMLDPSLPEQRLQTIVSHVKASRVLSSTSNRDLSSRLAQEVIVVDSDFLGTCNRQVNATQCSWVRPSPASAAYATFTSGSTGVPKGIVVTHRNFASAINHQVDALRITARSRIFDFSSYSFDISISYGLMTLAAGGCVCVPREQDRVNNLAISVESLKANTLVLTPTVARLLCPQDVPGIEFITFVGEALDLHTARQWWCQGKVQIINRYGASECTAACVVNRAASCPEDAVRIGKGLGQVTWVVDPENHERLMPLGCIGELLLEGPLVSPGYLDAPDKTVAAMVQNPSWLLRGSASSRQAGRTGKLYKTGDLVRYNEDGSLSYVGRKDTQVKLRGQRVELGEIEHHLLSCVSEARQVVVEVIELRGAGSNRELIAFVQLKEAGVNGTRQHEEETEQDKEGKARLLPLAADAQARLAEHLPGYMVPALYFAMNHLPKTTTGKTDRKQLRKMGSYLALQYQVQRRLGQSWRQPTSGAEKSIRDIWAEVLRINPGDIGLDDNFMHLGGDSIAAMKVVAAARKLGIMLEVTDIFRCPSLHQLADRSVRLSHPIQQEDIAPFSLLDDSIAIASILVDIASIHNIERTSIVDVYPCTPLQEGLMSLSFQRPGDYVMQAVLEISPDILIGRICAAWEEVVREMAILRTTLVYHDHVGLVQVVLNQSISWLDTTGLSLDDYLQVDRSRPMELGQALSRYAFVKDNTGATKWLVWTVHHALYDDWSIHLVMDALKRAARGHVLERSPQPQLFVKYIKQQAGEDMSTYWERALADYDRVPFPELPPSIEQPTPGASAQRQFVLPKGNFRNITRSSLIRAAWALIAGRMTNSQDVVFGVTVSGRNASVVGIDKMVVPTIATVPVRTLLVDTWTVSDYLEAVQLQSTEMMPFEQVGLSKLARMSPGAWQACQFQSLLVVQPERYGFDIGTIGAWSDGSQKSRIDTYALTLELQLGKDDMIALATFDPRVVEPWLMDNLLQRLEYVMHELDCASPTQILADVQVLAPEDAEQIWKWNAVVPARVERCVHKLIEEKAQAYPNAPAVCAWDGELTYSELDGLATKLALSLSELGVKPGVLVPLCFEKSMWTTVAIMGTIKAGGAFVLLDLSLPEQRLQTIVCQTKAKLILVSVANRALGLRLAEDIVTLGHDFFEESGHQKEFQDIHEPVPSSLIYATFTSGSTGNPKGVLISHANLASALQAQAPMYRFDTSTRVFDFASYSFDCSIDNVFITLSAGGCLCVPSDEDRKNNIAHSIISLGANVLQLTTSVSQLLTPSALPEVHTIVFGGEAVRLMHAERWWATQRVINCYGPSECTPTSTMSYDASSPEEAIRIGKGAGLVTWVVNAENHDELLPLGCIGELMVEGPSVGCGYLNDPVRTSATFVEDPAWLVRGVEGRPGRRGRLYKTGDLVQYNRDGSLSFVCRKDEQVKIRGQRVELGEVEHHVLACFPTASKVVAEMVVPRVEGGGTPILAAFMVMDREPTAEPTGEWVTGAESRPHQMTEAARVLLCSAEIELQLAACLPAYMVPALFIALGDDIPMNASGKTDRRRLRNLGAELASRQLAQSRDGKGAEKRAPSTGIECALQHIWARVLNLDAATIGVDDSFLRLGGDSISAMNVSAAARVAGISISTADILRKKTICLLAAAAATSGPALYGDILELDQDDDKPFPLSPIQLLYVASEPDPTRCFDQNFLLKLRQPVALKTVDKAFQAIVSRHPMLRARFSLTPDNRWEQRITTDVCASFHLTSVECSSAAEQAKNIRHCRQRLNIKSGPLLAAVLFQDADVPHSLFITAHHLVVDLVSWRVLLEELEMLFTDTQLPTLPMTSFRTWVSMQAKYIAEGHLADADVAVGIQPPPLSYWGVDVGDNIQGTTASMQFVLDEVASEAILGICNDAFDTRPVEIMVAALTHSFRTTFTDRSAPAIFSEGHGREPWSDGINLSRTVGWFTTIFPAAGFTKEEDDLLQSVRCTKDFSRRLSSNGWAYFTSKFSDPTTAKAHALELMPLEILFNFAGSYQQLEREGSLFERIPQPHGCSPASYEGMRRQEMFNFEAKIEVGRLVVTLEYPRNARHQDRIAKWVDQYRCTLQQAATILRDRSPEWTLADFPMAFESYNHIQEFQSCLLPQFGIESLGDIQDIYPCTGVQEGILLAQHKDPDNYRVVLKFEIEATRPDDHVESSRIEEAWRAVVRRHAILRALLVDTLPGGNRTMHIVLRNPCPEISHFDETAETVADGLSGKLVLAGYPRYGLQHHLSISRIDHSRVLLYLEINHAILDAHSSNVLFRDFWQAYHDKLDSDSPLYKDFIKYIERQSPVAAHEFWMRHLVDVQPCLFPSAPTDKEEHPFNVAVPNIEMVDVHTFCTGWEVTPAVVIQTAWALVLRQHTGSTTPCFGNLMSGRDVPVEGINDMIGPIIGLVPCRVRLDGQSSVIETLRQMEGDYIDSLPHQAYPLLQIHKALKVGSSGLFNSILNFQRTAYEPDQVPGEHTIHERRGRDPVEYPITVAVEDKGTSISIQLYFNGGFINRAQANRVALALGTAISSLVSRPESKIRDVSLLQQQDAAQLWSWNAEVPQAVDACVHNLIDEQVQSQPDATAICAWDGQLTYNELDERSSKLVGRLIGLGVGPNVLVPLCFEKSMWTSVAILGVLKAGGAFVLLDPSLPELRLQTIVQQLQAGFILTSPLTKNLGSRLAKRVVCVDNELLNLPWPGTHPAIQPEPSSTLFVVFTSGSTGTPKGAMLTHQNFCSGLHYQSRLLGFTNNSRVFDFASYAFDISVHNVLATLATGGCLCVPSDDERRNDISKIMGQMEVTVANLTPSVARLIDPAAVLHLETLILAGEAVSVDDVTPWWGKARVVNAYGPAECNISTINARQLSPHESTLIGKGAGLVTWVVEPENHNILLPPGCVGELLLEGPLVGRGYLNDAEKTAEAFIEDPVWLDRGLNGRLGRRGRLYKTGDLVRYNDQGDLIFAGRKDAQVKIRGQRIELGEVEHWVQHFMPGVKQAVAEVIVPRGDESSPTLVIFIQCGDEKTGAGGGSEKAVAKVNALAVDLEDKIAKYLPRHMVPTAIFSMEALPMTSTMKLDRRKLRDIGTTFSAGELAEARAAGRGPKRQPTSAAEESLQKIWAKVLNIDVASIGIDDGFFELGGDSIGAMRVVGESRKQGLPLAVADLFRRSSIAKLLAKPQTPDLLDGNLALDSTVLVEPSVKSALLAEIDALESDVNSRNVEDIVPLTNIQEKVLTEGIRPVASFQGSSTVDNITCGQLATYVYLDIGANHDLSFFEKSCVRTLERFPILRSCFLRLSGVWWQVVLRRLDRILRVDDVEMDIDVYLHDFCQKEAREMSPVDAPFSLMLARHASHGARLIIRLSHAQFDGISLPVIIQSLMDGDENMSLPPAPSFSKYLAYISRRSALSIKYWKNLLERSQPTRIQPCLCSPPGMMSEATQPKAIRLHAEMDVPHRPAHVTSATLVSTAWAVLLSLLTGNDDVVYGHLVSGRNASIRGVEDIVGCCVNIVPVRVMLSTVRTPGELLLAVQEQFLTLGEADSFGLKDIVQNCTTWSDGATFDSIIQHQNIDENAAIQLSEGVSRLQWFVNPELVPKCVYMISFPKDRKLAVQLSANTHIMAMETANQLIADLFHIIDGLVCSMNVPLQPWMEGMSLGTKQQHLGRTTNDCSMSCL